MFHMLQETLISHSNAKMSNIKNGAPVCFIRVGWKIPVK